jgi:O-antigen/teichoic acid export membrane protein
VASLLKRLAGASMIYGLGDLLTRSASFLLIPIYTRVLTPADYGILSSVSIMNAALSMFLGLSLNGALARLHYEIEDPEQRRTLYGTLFCFLLSWAGLLVVLLNTVGAPILDGLFRSVRFAPYLRLGTWIALMGGVSLLPLTMLQVQQRPLLYRAFTTASFLLTTGFILLFVVGFRWGALGSLYGQLIGGAVMALAYLVLMARHIRWTVSKDYLKVSLTFSLPLVVYAWGGLFNDLADRFFVERYTNLAELGWYNLASQYCLIITMIFNAVNMAWLPIFFETAKRTDAKMIFARYGELILGGALGLTVGMVVLAHEAIGLLAAPAFYPARQLVPLLAIMNLLNTPVWIVLVNPIFLVKQTRHLPWLTAVAGASNVLLNLWLTPRFGMMGAALATLLSSAVLAILAYIVVNKYYPIPYNYRRMGLTALAASLILVAAYLLHTDNPWISILLKIMALSLYPVLLSLFGVITRAEIQRGSEWLRRFAIQRSVT